MKSLRQTHGIIILAFLRVVIGVTFSCDYGWLLYRSRCYWRSVGEISGSNARGACRLRGAFLASVKDSDVQAFLQSRVMSAGDAWIGGTDERHEGTWMWLFGDDPFTYSNWNSGEPNNKNSNEDCLQFYHDKGNKWNDLPCDHKINGYICMKGGLYVFLKQNILNE